jgi:hypothetical protein
MTENKGLAIEDMMRTYVIPWIKKQLNSNEEIVANLNMYGIEQLDAMYVKNEAIRRENRRIISQVVNGEIALPADITKAQGDIQSELKDLGGKRFYKPSEINWQEEFKDFEWECVVDVTKEASFSKENLATLTTVLQTIANNPTVLTNPNAKLLFNKILDITGAVSPIELQEVPQQPTQQASTQVNSALAGGGTQ